MKRSTKIVVASIIGVGMVGVVTAKQFSSHCNDPSGHAFGQGVGSGKHAEWMSKRVSKKLDLNDTQQIELDKMVTQMIAGMSEIRAQRPQQSELQGLFDTHFDQSMAMQILEQRTQAMREQAPAMIESFAAFYDGLDAAQQATISDKIERKMARFSKAKSDQEAASDG